MPEISPDGPSDYHDVAPGSAGDAPWYGQLSVRDRLIAQASAAPRFVIYVATFFVCLLGWLWLGSQVTGISAFGDGESLGPGMAWVANWLASFGDGTVTSPTLRWFLALCAPGATDSSLTSFAVVVSMWMAMSIAMMLPSAAPMFRTYADIAEAALRAFEG